MEIIMKRTLLFLYGVASYAVFFGVFLYAIGFIGNIAVPKSMDSSPVGPFWTSFAIDLGLLSLFAIQHSGMARPAFKRWLTKYVPEAAERPTYVLLSSLCLIALFAYWAPLGGIVWNVTQSWAANALTVLYFASWGLLLYTTFLIDHFELFGLRHAIHALTNKPMPTLAFRTPSLYRLVRHPLYVGWLGIFWFAPTMTVTHLVFALVTTAYILVAIQLEERDLAALHPEYEQYKAKVPMLIPSLRRRLTRDAQIEAA
jgi:protein-S-isoprenylcysteine O-methyltransferase Ste14